ncbi:sigma-70 family RNA polymerase sigma factor [Longimicrobium terrae]|uniref:RNA polymerase sigma factor n=1 Tax=Longimicrobium terrae TaxID=1639882 RepID=A0A841GW88_9BACT|nr:RNA polymerase sigma-70 factor (ECF subfamily) [Longimicrobium terrae]MBB6069325.1 RNA polymerase sigma-70 factor (ECF subfamily) [Longimicrobium terrae]NNC31867.1 sigma-70 family RNA polymerase sigma factor [Longimicrobium terrae]
MNATQVSDHELVTRAQQGSEKAYRELLGRYERPVFSIIYRMIRDREQAEDLAQETFVRVFNHIDRYDPKYKFSSWIFKIATNLTIDHIRRKELNTVSIDGSRNATTAEQIEATAITIISPDENPEELLEAKELGEEIEEAIGRLRPEYRAAILLRHVEGREYQEIAEIMALPLGTVKTYIHRGRNELRETLQHLKV